MGTLCCINTDLVRSSSPYGAKSLVLMRQNVICGAQVGVRDQLQETFALSPSWNASWLGELCALQMNKGQDGWDSFFECWTTEGKEELSGPHRETSEQFQANQSPSSFYKCPKSFCHFFKSGSYYKWVFPTFQSLSNLLNDFYLRSNVMVMGLIPFNCF